MMRVLVEDNCGGKEFLWLYPKDKEQLKRDFQNFFVPNLIWDEKSGNFIGEVVNLSFRDFMRESLAWSHGNEHHNDDIVDDLEERYGKAENPADARIVKNDHDVEGNHYHYLEVDDEIIEIAEYPIYNLPHNFKA